MAPTVSPTIAARHDQMFPVLTDADIERMRRFGAARSYPAGERIVTAGEVSPGLVVILSGKVDITQAGGRGRSEPIISYGSGNFIGELAQLSSRPALINAEAVEPVEAVVIPCGGGGLTSGISIAVKDGSPRTDVWAVEPEHFDDTRRSLAAGAPVANEPGYSSICDAILTAQPGEITFEINRRNLAGAIAVSDKATAQAVRDAMAYLKLVVEPGCCVALAALSSGEIELSGKCVAVVLSGGNVDFGTYAEIMAAA